MKNKIILIIAILFSISCLAALPSAFTKRGNPELYREIRSKQGKTSRILMLLPAKPTGACSKKMTTS